MRAELTTLNVCAVLFLSRAAVNMYWYYYTLYNIVHYMYKFILYLHLEWNYTFS